MNASIQRGDRVRLTRERIDGTSSRSEWTGTVESVGPWGFALSIDGARCCTTARSCRRAHAVTLPGISAQRTNRPSTGSR